MLLFDRLIEKEKKYFKEKIKGISDLNSIVSK
jgi:hypothetical protein